MKKFFLACLLIVSMIAQAQIKNVKLQASGLTCSMCSKAIYKSLVAVPFVQSVESDIANSTFIIALKPATTIDIDALAKAVTVAGFSVANLTSTINFNNKPIKNDSHIELGNKTLHFLNVQPQLLNGDVTVRWIDKQFVTAKEFKYFNNFTKMKCYTVGFKQSCCPTTNNPLQSRIYHITI